MAGMRRTTLTLSLFTLLFLATGCPTTPAPVDIEIPPEIAAITADLSIFRPANDDALLTIEPGAVVDDLAELDGCWGGTLIEDASVSVALVVALQFDAAAGTYKRWSLVTSADGELLPYLRVLTLEEGTFEITSENTLRLHLEREFANLDPDTGEINSTLREVPITTNGAAIERPGVVTLSGDEMLFYIGAERVADVDPGETRLVFIQFACP